MSRRTWVLLGLVLAAGGVRVILPTAERPAPPTLAGLFAAPGSSQAPSADEETGRWSPPALSVRQGRAAAPPPPAAARPARPRSRPTVEMSRDPVARFTPAPRAGRPVAGEAVPGAAAAPEAAPSPADGAPAEAPSAAPAPPEAPSAAPAPAPTAAPAEAPPASTLAPTLTPPVPLSLPPPRHPMAWRVVVDAPGLVAEARPEHVTARVRLRLLIRADGTVGAVEVSLSSGRADLDAAAATAALAWRFAPARRDGEPVVSRVLIGVAFVLEP